MKTSIKLILAAALLGSLGFGGLARTVYANQSKPSVAIVPQHNASIKIAEVSDGDGEEADDAEEKQESSKLQALAKITVQQAQQAAETAQGAKASKVYLDNEDGNLVYKVTIGQTEVAVDAGNAKILYNEKVNQEDKSTEVTHPRSSIQVSETDAKEK
ncbi:MAG: PepSY domain-containing protein [Scytonematopsis contorta HA4267-MV1]|jgi:uncharacterized membrane protein YkoI|nr:PepSY domain-containing protein [Scytonematopsis contorta HA4267-MV1]